MPEFTSVEAGVEVGTCLGVFLLIRVVDHMVFAAVRAR